MDELIIAARRNDHEARNKLLALLRPRLRQWAEAALSERMAARIDASDLAQITLLDVHHRLDHFLGATEGELNEWVRRALQRNIIDEVRWATAKKRDFGREQTVGPRDDGSNGLMEELAADQLGPGSQIVLAEDCERLRQAIALLPKDQQEAVRQVFMEQQPLALVATRMGRSPGAVSKLLSRAVETLRVRLGHASKPSQSDPVHD